MPRPTYTASQPLLMEGHLFDSLTLNKVLDYILTHNAEFLLTSVQIGQQKTDASRVTFTLFAKTQAHLDKLMEELVIYGVQSTEAANSELVAVSQPSRLPEGAYVLGYLPVAVSTGSQTIASGGAEANALVLVAEAGVLKVVAQHQLQVGQNVVVGQAGLAWHLPE
jgi:hypothetical protein